MANPRPNAVEANPSRRMIESAIRLETSTRIFCKSARRCSKRVIVDRLLAPDSSSSKDRREKTSANVKPTAVASNESLLQSTGVI